MANVEEDLEDSLLGILSLGRLETPGVPFLESIATDAGRLGWDWQRQEPLSLRRFSIQIRSSPTHYSRGAEQEYPNYL